jgi:hypothetical protein
MRLLSERREVLSFRISSRIALRMTRLVLWRVISILVSLTVCSVLVLPRFWSTSTSLPEDSLGIGASSISGRYLTIIHRMSTWADMHCYSEHGAPHDRSRAIDTVIQNAPEYSMDQYASKVVEKCLKVGGNEFLDRYLDRVCEGRPDRPRIPLIDSRLPYYSFLSSGTNTQSVASDQYGNYLVQWILQHASMQHREQVASHIRKHMVSLRGSKFGSRVGMLCCNPIYNRPVPGPPSPTSRFNRFGLR